MPYINLKTPYSRGEVDTMFKNVNRLITALTSVDNSFIQTFNTFFKQSDLMTTLNSWRSQNVFTKDETRTLIENTLDYGYYTKGQCDASYQKNKT